MFARAFLTFAIELGLPGEANDGIGACGASKVHSF